MRRREDEKGARRSPRRSHRKESLGRRRVSGEERDSEGRKIARGDDEYGSEDIYSTSSSQDEEEYRTEEESEEYKHRRGVGISEDDDYRIMRSRSGEISNGKKSVSWRKEVDKRGSSTERVSGSPRRRSGDEKGSNGHSSNGDSRRSSREQSPRSPRGKDKSRQKTGLDDKRYDEHEKSDEEGSSNGVQGEDDRGAVYEKDDGEESNGKAEVGARSRSLRTDYDEMDAKMQRTMVGRDYLGREDGYYDTSLDDERKLYLMLGDSPRSRERERLIRRRRMSIRRRRRRAQKLKSGEPFDGQRSDIDGEGDVEARRHRTSREKQRQNELRRNYLNADVDAIDDAEYKEYDPEYDRDGDQRHDTCILPFEGYDESYVGPVGILTSKLPDGSSTAGTLFTTFDIHRRRSSLAFLEFYDLQRRVTGI